MKPKFGINVTFYRFLVLSGLMLLHVFAMAQNPVASFSMSPSSGCAPLNVQFTNSSLNAVSYQWTFGNGNTSTAINPSNVFVAPGQYNITLVATSSSGSTNTYSSVLNVTPKPIASFAVSQTTGCVNSQNFTFQNLSSNFDSCLWDFGDGTTSSVTSPNHTYLLAGTFSVTLVAYNKLLGCSDIETQSSLVTVWSAPTITFSSNDSITCNPSQQFDFVSNAPGGVSFQWNFGDGSTSSLQNPSHVYTDTGFFDVSLTVVSANGCPSTLTKNDYIHIKFNPVPVITASSTTGCQPFYLALITPYNASYSYSWDLGDTNNLNGFAQYHTYYTVGVFNPTVTVDYHNGCSNTGQIGPIECLAKPLTNYSFSNYIGCAPLALNFVNNTPGVGNTYLWTFGDGNTSNLAVPNYVYNIEGTYQISLTVTGSNGCSYGYPINANVIVYSPKAHFSPDVTSGCPPLSVNFSDHSTGATSWQWSFGDGSTSTAQHPSHVYNSIGNYTVTLIVTNGTGCSDTLVYPTHIVAAAPTVNYVTPAPIYGCVPFSANFADASTSSAWLWDFGDGTVSNLANPNHTYTSEGTFVVSLTTWGLNGGCERTISNFQTIIIDQAHPGFTYTVSPCPPYLVTFTDTSLNTVGWNWSFGDGGNSTLQNPTHVYNNTGSYNITLTGTSPTGCNTDVSISGGVVISGLGAHPSIQVLDTVAPFDVIFHANTQLATWWSWDFGDGSSSSLQNPSHTYLTSGPFTISLTIGNDSCQFTFNYPPVTMGSTGGGSVVIGTDSLPPPPIQYHCAPYEVSFVAPFPSVSSIEWNFGDGTTSTSLNPVHVFADSGVFVVSAIVNHSGVIDTVFMNEWYYIVEPVTDFQITTVNTCTGVITTAATASSASSYLWNFGNGITFNSASANYTYPNIDASYMVSLNISDTNQCSSFISKSFTINTLSPITANVRRTCANDSVLFNAGNINYNSYLWDFGDGNTSSIKNPAHAYADSGSYNVMLIVTDILGCSDTFNLAYQIIVYNPIASFNYTTTTNCTTVVVILNNTSINYSGYHWMFSDNSSSNSINPVKTFSTPGYYSLGLAVSNNICVDTMWMNNAIYVSRPVADFTFSQSSVCLPVTVNYIDLSIDANTWEWDFGDGTTSVLQNPSHVFTSVPHNPVTLKIKDVNGCQKVITKPNIEITYADFIATSSGNCNPVTVTFADSSHNAISWHWDFGDGTTSTNPNEVHTYTSNGIYNVELVVESAEGCFDTLRIDSLVNVGQSHADFSADSVSGCVPLMAQFTDLSTNVVAWDWDFGDGGTSTNQNPNHIFTTPGNYSIRLITTNSYGCKDTIVKSQFINVKGSVPMFSLSTVSGCAPLFVDFNDLSQGAIAWEWQFGDGTSDTSQSADHIYQNSGNYVASLFTTDSTGCLSIFTYPVAVTVSGVPIASFSVTNTLGCTPFNIEIVDSGSVADSLIWNMGDGNVIYGSNPVYTYNQPGVYHLQLIAKNNGGCTDTINYPDPIVVKLTPVASYVSDIQNGCSPVPVSFSNTSTDLDSPTYYWDFGNGDTSTESNPIYNYLDEGVYSPTLIVTNTGGCADTIVYVDYLDIYDQLPPSATQLYRVSVVDNNHVKVNWRLNLQNDMDYYVVYRYNASTSQFDSIATVPQNVVAVSGAAPEYIDSGLNTLQYSYTYKVKAVDLCGHSLPLSALKAHSTMELSSNAGNMQVSLAWSPYMGCEISAYEIYRTELNSSVNQLIATVDTLTLGYLDTTAYCPQDFGYSIRARDICGDANFDSWSDTTHALPFSNLDSQQLFITRSTVVDDKFVLTEWGEVNYRPDLVERFNIYRSTDKINYELIASVPSIVHDYSDWDVNVDYNAYYYKVEIQNVCNTNTLEGNISSSILLNAIQTEVSNHLKWSKYVDWNTGVERYVIEKLNLAGQWEVIETVPGSTTEWEEE